MKIEITPLKINNLFFLNDINPNKNNESTKTDVSPFLNILYQSNLIFNEEYINIW